MSATPPAAADDQDDSGILGNLPRTRPSVRSPRRAQPTSTPNATATGSDRDAGEPEPADAGDDDRRSREQELEQLARAGISLAGGAATLGLRAAGRAAAALRGAVERR